MTRSVPRMRGRLAGALLLVCSLATVTSAPAQETVTLNLKEADINALISTVSEMTGRNFIVDPRVKGRVTVVSSHEMGADELYEVFQSVLTLHGFAAVQTENAVKIVPEINAKQDAIPTVNRSAPGSGDAYVTQVIPVDNVNAAQLVPILRPLLPQQGHLAAYPDTNVLIASATAANVARIDDIVRRIDRENNQEVEVIALEHASAAEVVRILDSLSQSGGKARSPEQPTMVADERTNSILLSGGQSQRLRLRTIIAHLDTPLETGGNTEVVYLRYADAEELLPVVNGVSEGIKAESQAQQGGEGKAALPASQRGEVSIQADKSTNALVITAPPDVMRSLKTVIRRLDIRRAQVLVEAVIAEVSSEAAKELGVQWAVDGSPENQPVGLVEFGGSGSGVTNLLLDPPSISDGLNLILGDTEGNGNTRLGVFLRALAGDADTNILSTPTLVTMDNEEAEIVVGQNVPFVTGSYSSTGTGSTPTNPFQTIQRQDVGLTLKVTPQINEGDAVKLSIVQEVSSIAPSSSGAADIITNKRSLKTTVLVDDGQALVLGGLVTDDLQEQIQKVPGLGDIPLLGNLFSYKNSKKVKRNLMVFLHPVILRDASQNARVSGEKYSYLRAQQLKIRERGVSLLPDETSPLLPEWEEFLELPPPFEETRAGRDAPPVDPTL